jgi:hypothetical protein
VKRRTTEDLAEEAWHKHLEFIQNAISRMTQNSYLLKGWTVTLVAATFAVSISVASVWLVVTALFPTVAFALLDARYLREERLFRRLYDAVRRDRDKNQHEKLDKVEAFSMDTQPYEKDVEQIAQIMASVSILTFYGSIALVIVLAGIARALLPA